MFVNRGLSVICCLTDVILCLYILLISFFPSICLVIRINLISLVTSRLDVYVVVSSYKLIGNIYNKRERKMFYLTTHSTHFIYGYMASDIWLGTILIVRKETRCRHIGYSYLLTARVLLYAPSHRQDNTYHGLCYTSRGALAGTRNSSMGYI